MRNVWFLYGKNFLTVAGVLIGFFVVGSLLRYEWIHHGVASDREKEDWEESIFADETPILDARCQRFRQGDTVYYKDLASAYERGNDISGKIRYLNENGEVMNGKLNTETPGQYVFIVSVKSDYTGKKVVKKIRILVDGKVKQ